jgi:hypothetical protein
LKPTGSKGMMLRITVLCCAKAVGPPENKQFELIRSQNCNKFIADSDAVSKRDGMLEYKLSKGSQ